MLSNDRRWWTIPELAEEFCIGQKLVRKLVTAGCLGAPFQPSGPGGKLLFHRDAVEDFVARNMEANAKELDISL